MRTFHKRVTYEDKFDRKYAIGYWRVSKEIKTRNNRTFRRFIKRQTRKDAQNEMPF